MKCIGVNCKKSAIKQVKCLWGKNEVIGFCDEHQPEWLNKMRKGDLSPEVNTLGKVKSWYKRVL